MVIMETTFDDVWNLTPNRLFINTGDTKFTEAHFDLIGGDQRFVERQGRGEVAFDYDRDGDIDIFIVNHAEKQISPQKRAGISCWRLPSSCRFGGVGKRVSSGARVELTLNKGETNVRIKVMDSITGFQAQSELVVHFGLGISLQAANIPRKSDLVDGTVKRCSKFPEIGARCHQEC